MSNYLLNLIPGYSPTMLLYNLHYGRPIGMSALGTAAFAATEYAGFRALGYFPHQRIFTAAYVARHAIPSVALYSATVGAGVHVGKKLYNMDQQPKHVRKLFSPKGLNLGSGIKLGGM